MVLLKEITETLEPYPDLHDSLPFLDAERFIRFAVRVKREIQLNQPATPTGPPLRLPIYIHEFLRDGTGRRLSIYHCATSAKATRRVVHYVNL